MKKDPNNSETCAPNEIRRYREGNSRTHQMDMEHFNAPSEGHFAPNFVQAQTMTFRTIRFEQTIRPTLEVVNSKRVQSS